MLSKGVVEEVRSKLVHEAARSGVEEGIPTGTPSVSVLESLLERAFRGETIQLMIQKMKKTVGVVT